MCAFSAMVFVSVFQLLPAAPYRVLELGGTAAAAGLFLGLLAYSSAFSAPVTGPIGDRLGHRRVLIFVSLTLAVFSASYAVIPDYRLLLVVVAVHGLFWSALLSSSGAYMTATIPASRRAEGLSYWGLTSIIALGAAPALGFWVHRFGWATLCLEIMTLNLVMAAIAWRLPDDRHPPDPASHAAAPKRLHQLIEWRVHAAVDRDGDDLVRLRRPDQFFGAVRRRAAGDAAKPVPDARWPWPSVQAGFSSAGRSIASATAACCCRA